MARFKFYPKTKTAKSTYLILSITENSQQVKYKTTIIVNPKNWNSKTQSARGIGAPELNNDVVFLKNKISELFSIALKENRTPKEYEILEAINSKEEDKKKELKFLDHYTNFLSDKKEEVKPLTYKKYITLEKLLKEFKQKKKFKLSFDVIDHKFEKVFRKFLENDKKQLNDTITKYIEVLKLFMRYALKEKLHTSTDFEEFSVKRAKDRNDAIYLTSEELEAIEKLDLTNNDRLRKVRDMFVFQTYTGQRFSDIQNLKHSDIKETKEGMEWHLWQIKGNKPIKLEIPLFKTAIEILKQYQPTEERAFVFPEISNAKCNEYLKEVCKEAKVKGSITLVRYSGKERKEKTAEKHELISTHCARRTFVTLSLERGMKPETIMRITGHTDYRTMEKYLNISKQFRDKEARNAWEAPEEKEPKPKKAVMKITKSKKAS
jgi:site-specific recombinase XerD